MMIILCKRKPPAELQKSKRRNLTSIYLKLTSVGFPSRKLPIHNTMNIRLAYKVVNLTRNAIFPKDKRKLRSVKNDHEVSKFYASPPNTQASTGGYKNPVIL
jgi:hypothetical protein